MSGSSDRRPRRRFTAEFKADAVRLVDESGGQIAKVAKELGLRLVAGQLGSCGPGRGGGSADGSGAGRDP